jgi:hypothetical protein
MNAIQLFAVAGRGRVHFRPSPTRITSIGPGLNELKIQEAKCGKALLRDLVVSCGDTRDQSLSRQKQRPTTLRPLQASLSWRIFFLRFAFPGMTALLPLVQPALARRLPP